MAVSWPGATARKACESRSERCVRASPDGWLDMPGLEREVGRRRLGRRRRGRRLLAELGRVVDLDIVEQEIAADARLRDRLHAMEGIVGLDEREQAVRQV